MWKRVGNNKALTLNCIHKHFEGIKEYFMSCHEKVNAGVTIQTQ